MIRIKVIVEGETEETFVKELVYPLLMPDVCLVPILLGGLKKYANLKKMIQNLLEDRSCRVTSMIDLYGLDRVSAFPKLAESHRIEDFYHRANFLEAALAEDISNDRFFPNLIVHEFEALLFSDTAHLAAWTGKPKAVFDQMLNEVGDNPEAINNSPHTAPSKRILSVDPTYQKVLQGNLTAIDIGIVKIRMKCPKFERWLHALQSLGIP